MSCVDPGMTIRPPYIGQLQTHLREQLAGRRIISQLACAAESSDRKVILWLPVSAVKVATDDITTILHLTNSRVGSERQAAIFLASSFSKTLIARSTDTGPVNTV